MPRPLHGDARSSRGRYPTGTRSCGLPDPTKSEFVRLTLRGVRRLHGRPQRRVAPLKVEHLAEIFSRLGMSTRDVRDRAMLLVGFAGAFRRSELCGSIAKSIERKEQGVIVTLRGSKTDQEGRGRSVAIPRIGGPICPVAALETGCRNLKSSMGPLFRPVSKAGRMLESPLSASAVATIVKQRVAQIGLDPARYSGHSLRAGFATSAAAAGLPVWKIKGQTGHVSDAVLSRYIRETDYLWEWRRSGYRQLRVLAMNVIEYAKSILARRAEAVIAD